MTIWSTLIMTLIMFLMIGTMLFGPAILLGVK